MRSAALESALLVLLTWAVVSADPKPGANSWPGGWKARGDAGGKPGIGKHASPRTESKSPKTEAKWPVAAASKMIKGKIGKVGWQPFSKSGWKGIMMNMTAAVALAPVALGVLLVIVEVVAAAAAPLREG